MHTRLAFVPRILVAVVVVLALLSGVAPFSSATSEHLCTMECCAGLAPHAAGSCHMDMSMHGKAAAEDSPKPAPEELCGLPEAETEVIKGVAAGVMGMKTSADPVLDLDGVTIDAPEHCTTNSQSEATSSHSDSSQPPSIAQSFSKPCPPECGTAPLSSGVRPSRHSATLAYNARPRPPTLGGKCQSFNSTFLSTYNYCKHLRPRGPPSSFS